jgi:hypothetical protein
MDTRNRLLAVLAAVLLMSGTAGSADQGRIPIPAEEDARPDIQLPGQPPDPAPDSYGYDNRTGVFKHPAMTPATHRSHPFAGSLDYLDQREYRLNTEVLAYYPFVVATGHTWQATFDLGGRRYMYHYYSNKYKVYDVTDVRDVKLVADRKIDTANGEHPFGPFVTRWNARLGKLIAVQCYQVPRYGILENKYTEPDKVQAIRNLRMLHGFRIFEIAGPTDWRLLSETALDPLQDPQKFPQQGSGCIDVPTYFGDRYLFVAGAPDDSYSLQEYPSILYSAAQLAYDISDPAHPKRLGVWSVPGQRVGEEEAYRRNPRYGNKTSWMGARMAMFIPRPIEAGGKYGYAAMGGLGFFVVDISDPSNMRTVGHLDMPQSTAGNEGDNIDITKVETTGMVYFSGYPMNDDCYEPYKEIYQIDVRDPANPRIVNTLPRPKPPKDAAFTDFCQRRGSFGPKRTGYFAQQPGTPSSRYLPYAFYNAGMQMFDVSDPAHPRIAAYFVPKMADPEINLAYKDPVHGVYIEWDRNIIWVMSNHGMYAVSSPLLGKPVLQLPD